MSHRSKDYSYAIANARRLFHHEHIGGQLKPSDVSNMVKVMETMQETINSLEEELFVTLEELERNHG